MTARPLPRLLSAIVLLALGLSLMAGLAAFGFVKARSLESQIEANRAQLRALRRRALSLTQNMGDADAARRADAALSLLLPTSLSGSAAALLQSELIEMVKRAGGRAGVVRVLPSQTDRSLTRVSVSMGLQVTMAGLRKFLFELETSTPLIFVDQLEISADPPSEQAAHAPDDTRRLLNINVKASSFMPRKDGPWRRAPGL